MAAVSTSGIYSVTVTDLSGCINPVFTATDTVNILQGDSIFVGGAWQTQSGIYSDNYLSQFGCDSAVITIVNVITGVEQITASASFSVIPNPASETITVTYHSKNKQQPHFIFLICRAALFSMIT